MSGTYYGGSYGPPPDPPPPPQHPLYPATPPYPQNYPPPYPYPPHQPGYPSWPPQSSPPPGWYPGIGGGDDGGWGGWPPGGPMWPPQPPPKRGLHGGALAGLIIAMVLILGVATAIAIGVGRAMRDRTATATDAGGTPTSAPYSRGPTGQAGPLDANAIAAKVDPGVVDVNTVLGFQNARAAGTGIILTATGLVLTNNHVIADATQISVTSVGNGRTYQASVVGYDRAEDVAVIQLKNASGLHPVTIGDSSKVRVGDPIVAIGNAGGTGGTPAAVTGTVSALDQAITATDENGGSAEQLTGLIEVAADIQSGDSGGPLVNGAGQVIGIDTAAAVDFQMQASGGQGYAIPINQAMSIGNQIRNGQASSKVHIGETAFLGVQTQAPSGRSGGGGGSSGAPVAGVVSGSPADDLGLQQGDTVVSLDGQQVDSPTTLTNLMDKYHPGDKVTVGWTDGTGQRHNAGVKLATGPAG